MAAEEDRTPKDRSFPEAVIIFKLFVTDNKHLTRLIISLLYVHFT